MTNNFMTTLTRIVIVLCIAAFCFTDLARRMLMWNLSEFASLFLRSGYRPQKSDGYSVTTRRADSGTTTR